MHEDILRKCAIPYELVIYKSTYFLLDVYIRAYIIIGIYYIYTKVLHMTKFKYITHIYVCVYVCYR